MNRYQPRIPTASALGVCQDTVTPEYKVVDGHNQATLVAQYVMRCVNAYDAIRVKVRKALGYGEEGKEKVS